MILFLGSGGHTTEILQIVEGFDFSKFDRLVLLKSESDKTSEDKFFDFRERSSN